MKKNTQLFYQQEHLFTVSENIDRRTVFRGNNTLLAEKHITGTANSPLMAADMNGSTLRAYAGNHQELHSYSAYGHNPDLPSKQTACAFNGEFFEGSSSAYPLGQGYRLFSPSLMRFLAADNLSPFGEGGLNAYAYCLGDPVNRTDPTGHWSFFKKFNFFRKKTKPHTPESITPQQREDIRVSRKAALVKLTEKSTREQENLKTAIADGRYSGKLGKPQIDKNIKIVTKTTTALEQELYENPTIAYDGDLIVDWDAFNAIKDARDMIRNYKKNTEAFSGIPKSKKRTYFSPTRRRDDRYDDKNYRW